MQSADQIAATFASALIPVDQDQADLLAQQLDATNNDLERLIGELLHSEHPASQSGMLEALAYKSALADAADPSRIVGRLRRQADALDATADSAVEEGAEFAGKGAIRRMRGEITLAEQFEQRAAACHAIAVEATTEAFNKRVLADRMEAANARAAEIAALLNPTQQAA